MSKSVSFSRQLLLHQFRRSQELKSQWRTSSPPRNGPFKTKCRNIQEVAWEKPSHLVKQRNLILEQAVLRHLAYKQKIPAIPPDCASALSSLLTWFPQYFTMIPCFGNLFPVYLPYHSSPSFSIRACLSGEGKTLFPLLVHH